MTTTIPFERAVVYEGAQIGIQSVLGTPVAATKRLLGAEFMMDAETNVTMFRPQGSKANTTSFQGKEMSTVKLRAALCFNDAPYLFSTWLNSSAPVTPANNSTFAYTGASGTFGFTYKGSVLAPASWASAAALQTAIEALASVGIGNVLVTSPGGAGTFTIQFIAALSTDDSAITSVTGTPAATPVAPPMAILTRRWVFTLVNWGPDAINLFSVEKGAKGVANMGKRAASVFARGMSLKFNKSECSIDGDMLGQLLTDAFTLTPSGVTDVVLVPAAPKQTSVFYGDSLNDPVNGLSRLGRCLGLDFGATNKAGGIITLDDTQPSFSNRVETVPSLTAKWMVEEDAVGQAIFTKLRAGTPQFVVVENIGPTIEAGYNYRFKAVTYMMPMKPNEGDTDGVLVRDFDCELQYSPAFGTALQITVDCAIASL